MPSVRFSVAADAFRLSWTGPCLEHAGGGLLARSLRGRAVSVGVEGGGSGVPLALVEEGTYAVLLQSRTGEPVALRHRDPVLTASLIASDGGHVVHGPVRIGSQAGHLRVVVAVGGRPEVEVEWPVVPTKATAADLAVMRAEVEATGAGLGLAALRPTTEPTSEAGAPSPPATIALLRAAAPRLAEALRVIERRPRAEVRAEAARRRPSSVRRAVPATVRALRLSGTDERPLPARRATTTLDTGAHRWLAASLDRVLARLRHLRRVEARRTPTLRRQSLVAELGGLADRLAHARARAPLAAVQGPAPTVPPLTLRRQAGYADAYAALRLLDAGLDLAAGAIETGMQDLAVLYETWAALTVVRVAADVLGVEAPASPFGVAVRGADVRLRRGRRHAVQLAGGRGRVEVVYSPRFNEPTALLAQRPDLLVTVTPTGRPARHVVLDAKYRRDDSAGYRRRHGVADPPEDALGALHRYRDAIVGPGGRTGWISDAVALYPDRPGADRFSTSRLWTSLGEIGVGAVPVLPGETAWLRRLLSGWLGPA